MNLRQLSQRKERPAQNIYGYVTAFSRKRKTTTRVAVLERMYTYLLTIPDFLATQPVLRETIIRKTEEFKAHPETEKIRPLLIAVSEACLL